MFDRSSKTTQINILKWAVLVAALVLVFLG